MLSQILVAISAILIAAVISVMRKVQVLQRKLETVQEAFAAVAGKQQQQELELTQQLRQQQQQHKSDMTQQQQQHKSDMTQQQQQHKSDMTQQQQQHQLELSNQLQQHQLELTRHQHQHQLELTRHQHQHQQQLQYQEQQHQLELTQQQQQHVQQQQQQQQIYETRALQFHAETRQHQVDKFREHRSKMNAEFAGGYGELIDEIIHLKKIIVTQVGFKVQLNRVRKERDALLEDANAFLSTKGDRRLQVKKDEWELIAGFIRANQSLSAKTLSVKLHESKLFADIVAAHDLTNDFPTLKAVQCRVERALPGIRAEKS